MSLTHPQTVNGKLLWMDSGVSDLIHKLNYGDPVLGWEGDPALALFMDKDPVMGDRWVLVRLEDDGEYRDVMRSRPGLPLDERLLIRLMEHDSRRGFEAASVIEEAYDPFSATTAADEAAMEGLERAYHGLAKDIGHI